MFEAVDDPGSNKRRTQIDRQPCPAGFHRFADRGEDILFIAQAAHPPQIVIGFFINHIDDLIDGQAPDQLAVGINDGGAEQVITFEGARHLLRLFVRLKGDRVALHHLPHPLLRIIEQNGLQLQLAEQQLVTGGDEQLIGVFRHFTQTPQIALHRRQRGLRSHRNDLKLHDRPDAVVGVAHNLANTGALLGRQGRQQPSGQVARQMLQQVNLFIDIQRLHGLQQLGVAHLVDQVAPDVL